MDAGVWEVEFAEARQRLIESVDFHILHSRGHYLKDAVVLTSVSEVPFEVSLKCIHCRVTFWFENAAWSTGGIGEWRLSGISMQAASVACSRFAMVPQHQH
jgi:hypothetical protein